MSKKKVVLTNHAEEKRVPDFEIRNILEKKQGRLFHDSLARVKKKTVVIFEDRPKEKVVITAYRKNSPTKFSNSRFKEVRNLQI